MHSKSFVIGAIIALSSGLYAQAQVTVDVTKITCDQYVHHNTFATPDQIAAWMSGYFRASTGQTVFDFQRFANNKRAVGNFCKKNGTATVMSAIQRSIR